MKHNEKKKKAEVAELPAQPEKALSAEAAATKESIDAARAEKNNTVRAMGILFVLFGLAMVLYGIFMFTQTWGTHLLFVSSSAGRFYGNYPIFLIIGAVMASVAVIVVVKHPRQKVVRTKTETPAAPVTEEQTKAPVAPTAEEQTKVPAAPVTEEQTEVPKAPVCPACGSPVGAEDKFCLQCGQKLG